VQTKEGPDQENEQKEEEEQMNLKEMFCPCCGVLRLEGCDILDKTFQLELKWEFYHRNKGQPIGPQLEVSSGYRCAEHNEEVGGSEHSQHLLSRAMDIRKKDRTPLTDEEAKTLKTIAEELEFTGIILYSHHIHVDTREGTPYKANKRNEG